MGLLLLSVTKLSQSRLNIAIKARHLLNAYCSIIIYATRHTEFVAIMPLVGFNCCIYRYIIQ